MFYESYVEIVLICCVIFFISVFRQGDTGKCWYAVLAGSLDVRISQPDADPKVSDIYGQHKREL